MNALFFTFHSKYINNVVIIHNTVYQMKYIIFQFNLLVENLLL